MPRPLLLLLLPTMLAATGARADDVRRCVDAEGRAVYTDQPCETQQAVPRAVPGAPPVGEFTGGFTAPDCARTPAALRDGVREALAAGDANRLAGYYHWPGTTTRGGRHLMDELEAIAARPLVGIGWWPPREGTVGDTPAEAPALAAGEPPVPAPVESLASPPPTPWPALRVEQSGGVGDPAAHRTDFRLVRNAGCWWIEL